MLAYAFALSRFELPVYPSFGRSVHVTDLFRDPECTEFYCTFPRSLNKRRKFVTVDCCRYRLVWVPEDEFKRAVFAATWRTEHGSEQGSVQKLPLLNQAR